MKRSLPKIPGIGLQGAIPLETCPGVGKERVTILQNKEGAR
jgi:hypothetical protein